MVSKTIGRVSITLFCELKRENMVRKSFIKALNDEEMTLWDNLHDLIFHNEPLIFFRHIGRFLKRLPSYLKLCWRDESWDYEGLYNYIEFFGKERIKALEEDTWHTQHCTKRAIQQIKCTLGHLDRFRNWTKYWDWPEPIHKKLPNGCYTLEYKPEDEPQCELVHRMEEKHYKKFWDMLRKYHNNWWT